MSFRASLASFGSVALLAFASASAADAVEPAAPVFTTPAKIEPAMLHALCVQAQLPMPTNDRGIGVLVADGRPAETYAWVWIDAQALTDEELAWYTTGAAPFLQEESSVFDSICPDRTAQMKSHTVVMIILNTGNLKEHVVLAGTAAKLRRETVSGDNAKAHQRALRLAEEVVGSKLILKSWADTKWTDVFPPAPSMR